MIEPAEELVTVFGGGGFIGRYVCERLLQTGVRIRVASRDPRCVHFLQPLAQVGQIGFVRADIGDRDSVMRAVAAANRVVNLCGVMKGKVHGTHVDGARHVAEAAREGGAWSLVHVSAIGADPQSQSLYGRTKGEGELAIRSAFPRATIVRPSLVFGREDQLTNRFANLAKLPLLPVIASNRKFQPVYVADLAEAIARAVLEPKVYGGKDFEIGGPQVMTMRELIDAVLDATGQTPQLIELADFAARIMASFGWLPFAPLTKDQWLMLQQDNVMSSATPGLDAFGIKPTPLAAVGHEWLGRFHQGGRFGARRINITATN